jgi:hypothetical protein
MVENGNVQAPFAIPTSLAIELYTAGELLDVGDGAQQVGQKVLAQLQAEGIDSPYKYVALFILSKALKTIQAVQILARCGYGSDGLSLCAVLFENLVDLLYIGLAPVRRARRFMQFENVQKFYQACKVLKRKRLPKGRRKIYEKYRDDLLPEVRPLLRFFETAKGKPTAHGWSLKSVSDRAEAVKAGLAYQELYWVFCAHKHTTPMVAVGLIPNATPDLLIPTNGPDMAGVCHAAEQATELFLKICFVIEKEFNLSLRAEVEKCLEDLQNAVHAVRKQNPRFFE